MAVTPVYLLNQRNPVIITGGFVPKGAYDNAVDYSVGDSVDYNGSSYVMFVDAAAGTLPTGTTKWQVIANKGATGATGAQGIQGVQGDPGVISSVTDTSSVDLTLTGSAISATVSPAGVDHNSLANLATGDVHTQYALLAGRAGGQTLIGGSAVTDILKLEGTSGNGTLTSPSIQALVGNNGATVAYTVLNNGNVGIGTTAPVNKVEIKGSTTGVGGTGSVLKVVQDGGWSGNNPYALEVIGYSSLGGLRINSSDGQRTFYAEANELGFGANNNDISFSTSSNGSTRMVVIKATSGNVGIGTTSPNANAILDCTSTTKAFMPPRMTTTQKNAVSSPTAGMVVYDSTLNKLCLYTTAWETLTSS